MSTNTVSLVGHLTRDPELRHVGAKNTALATFGIAVTKKRGETEYTGFFDVKCWGGVAEAVAEDLRKGDGAIVMGELSLETWLDKQTGAKRSKVTVQADAVGINLYVKKDGTGTGRAKPATAAALGAVAKETPAADPADEESVPF